jgi:hypothetical protein
MQCRKQISLFLAALILVANLGLTLSVHYCHDKIASITFQLQNEEPCISQDEDSCCATVISHNSCCSNRIIKVAEKSDTVEFKTPQLDFEGWVVTTTASSIVFQSSNQRAVNSSIDFCFDSHAPPLYKMNCQFVFYA